jgi:hydroxylamine dehydrogenase
MMCIKHTTITLIALFLAMATAFAELEQPNKGIGLYDDKWQPDPMHEYWDPESFHSPEKDLVEGIFKSEECVECHEGVTPGIVKDWQKSAHFAPSKGNAVSCNNCHGNDHQALVFPTPETCGNCHKNQHRDFLDERRFGFPSHALAMERAVDAPHFVDKPKAEVLSCVQCHSVATKCDSCHTRHRFSAAEARRPEACITCHSGPPHPDDEAYFASAHGQLYLAQGSDWDFSKPLTKGNYKAPTCAYCHMRNGKHQVADKSIHKFGIREVNTATGENRIKRKRWLAVCMDCHPKDKAEIWLKELDQERQKAWPKLYKAEKILKDLRGDDLIYPSAQNRPGYPLDWMKKSWSKERIGFYEGQASALYNVSPIERDYFEMWYFDNLHAYKGAAHGAPEMIKNGHKRMDRALKNIKKRAKEIREQNRQEKKLGITPPDPKQLWQEGEYTHHNKENN